VDLGFKDKVAMVTGTASQIGMGKAIALTLAKEGCHIISCDIDLAGAKKTAAEATALGHKALAFKVDITNKAEVDNIVKAALKEFGKIDILVNTAGAISPPKPFIESTDEQWQRDININLYGTVHCCRAVLPGMVEHKYGKIVNFSSIASRIGGQANGYGAAKTAILGLTRGLATEYGPSGINVNGIAPGMVLTNFGGGPLPLEVQERFRASVPTRKISTTKDIANAVVFLASDISGNITGQVISIDGGATMP
jgi:NAD(P)-dependent dehydrogenase (short-subunit alcohol dehydrogenase family)